jgi:hypothetical protein
MARATLKAIMAVVVGYWNRDEPTCTLALAVKETWTATRPGNFQVRQITDDLIVQPLSSFQDTYMNILKCTQSLAQHAYPHYFLSSLSESQRQLYSLEKSENFRWVAAALAKPPPQPLTSDDLTDLDLQVDLAEITQYAEVAHGKLPLEFIWGNLDRLLQRHFPLQGYDALRGSKLIEKIRGTVGGYQGYIARKSEKVIVAFSGTSSPVLSLNNLDVRRVSHPAGDECCVHGGFWRIYSGIREQALAGLVKAMKEPGVKQLIFTGHSLGSAICYLLALDTLEGQPEPETLSLLLSDLIAMKIAVIGCPRIGNAALADYWHTLCANRRECGLVIEEYSVKGYNDGSLTVAFFLLISKSDSPIEKVFL